MRVFLSIRLTQKMRNALENVIRDMKRSGAKGNYSLPCNMHITLAFLGEVPGVEGIEGFGHFGELYWVGLAEQPLLEQLVKNIRRVLDDNGIAYDRKKFRAHITVARRVQAAYPIRVRIPRESMEVTAFSLMKSERINGKIKYTEIACWEAGKKK